MSYFIQPLVNGKAVEHADIELTLLGVMITGFTDLEYEEKQDMENVYAGGRYANARIYGQIKPTAKISLLASEVEALQQVAPGGRIQDIPEFDIAVSYIDAAYTTIRHKLKNVRIMNNPRKSTAGGGAIVCELELIISHVEIVV
jgi:hypothetical protein